MLTSVWRRSFLFDDIRHRQCSVRPFSTVFSDCNPRWHHRSHLSKRRASWGNSALFSHIWADLWRDLGATGGCTHKHTQKHAFSHSFQHIWSIPPHVPQQPSSTRLQTELSEVCKYLVSNYLLFFAEEFRVNANTKVTATARPVAASCSSCLGSAWSLKTSCICCKRTEQLCSCVFTAADAIMEHV